MMPSATLASWRACAGLETPKPTATGTGLTARTSRTKRPTPGASRFRAPGDPGERDRVEEALRACGHERAPPDGRRRRHEIDDADAEARRLGLQLRALVRREVGEDEARHAGLAQAAQDGGPVSPPEHLIDVAHGHQRRVRARRVDAAHQLDGVVEPRSVPQRDRARPLQRRAIGQRIRVGQADLEEVGARIDLGDGDGQGGGGIGVARHGIGDERGASVGRGLLECSRDMRGPGWRLAAHA